MLASLLPGHGRAMKMEGHGDRSLTSMVPSALLYRPSEHSLQSLSSQILISDFHTPSGSLPAPVVPSRCTSIEIGVGMLEGLV